MQQTGSQVLFTALKEENVDTLFGYPGGCVMDIYDEMSRQQIRHILVRHEQGAVHAADGYARASGRVGVCLVTSGPGATNTVTGIANAYMDSIPVVVLTGQVPTAIIGSDGFQEVDITGITRTCTKHNFLVRDIGDLHRTVREAFQIARSGRPGPVLVDLPKDVIQSVTEAEPLRTAVSPVEEGCPDLEGLCNEALKMLLQAKKPLIIVGGGVILGKASEIFRAFARKFRIPVVSTLMGLGAFPASDPLWTGMLGMHGAYSANMAVSQCDLLMAVGVRFDDRATSKVSAFAPHARIIHIDIDPVSIDRIVRTDLAIVSHCIPALKTLHRLSDEQGLTPPERQIHAWRNQLLQWKAEMPLGYCRNQNIKPQYVIEKLHQLTQGRAIIATEVGQHQMWAAQFYRFDDPNAFLTSGGLGTMGFGLPAAIGAQVACPDRIVVDVAGDGSIQMNIQELGTIAHYGLPVKVVILNNLYLGMIRQWQELFYGRRYSQSDMSQAPDFVKLAEAYGIKGLRATKPEEVKRVLREGLETPGPVVMDFHVESEENVFPMVKPGTPLTEMAFGNVRAVA
ncbi:MAG: acetolactate synthase, large subunit, biosynthetic type [Syntrophobacterales bacterium CG_4_8_14_3_um_filter_58_8]|nr:MAG: acetolactate synthase, large subunit, biosynthetic type [Syntrophaceae bacterium CG2_30_58_14]PIV07369.1 MAG: acetolactate synthase, large subunit, biosynthetic type [Syntrophobacterales bacterium CG03_land_8_20_14_0_80_58_14]PJC76612.1 MAG: acetolactate synthase, large subunit, biosynthetic type [Syntrophobacterales bacterium CG_4_8_14_3_um_filter_58_8]